MRLPTDIPAPTDHTGVEQRIVLRARLRQADFLLDLDLALPGRGVTGLFGHSGSGKTTCLRILAGLIKADSGYLCVNGETWLDTDHGIDLPTHQRALGYVFQEPSLFAHMNVLRNLQYGQKRVPASQHRVEMAHMTQLLGIDHLLTRMPENLSGGERQRVGIARALLTSPRLLLMDEPLAALDLKRKREILPYLQRLHDELEIPVIYVSHSPDEMAQLADHLVVLDAGRAVASGPITDTLARLDLPASHAGDALPLIRAPSEHRSGQYRHCNHAESVIPENRAVGAKHDVDVRFRLRVRQGEAIAIGPGKIALLEAIRACGSISAAARSLGMSYRRAWMLLEELNACLASPATLSEQGGSRGGGSALTPVGESIIDCYRAIEQRASQACAADIAHLTSLLK